MPVVCSAILAVLWSGHWPLVGDASLMHYVVFLAGHGLEPYRDVVDINLPGSYLVEAAGMRLFGADGPGWRIFDLSLCMGLGVAAAAMTDRKERAAGCLAGAIFFLLHAQDGVAQSGQRDLSAAALILAGYALLFQGQRRQDPAPWVLGAMFCCSLSGTIKPAGLVLAPVLLVLFAVGRRQEAKPWRAAAVAGVAGWLLPPAIASDWLLEMHAWLPFVREAEGLIPYHASLGHRTFLFLCTHAFSPVAPVAVVWLVLQIAGGFRRSVERWQLLAGLLLTLAAYIEQGKGFAYQRYSFLALLLVITSRDLLAALRRTGNLRLLAAAALLFECLVLAPRSAWLVHRYRAESPFTQALAADLTGIGTAGGVQCLDTFGGCVNTLYNLRVVQSTGFLYDCYLFRPKQNRVTEAYRAAFWSAFVRQEPRTVVLTDQYCFNEENGFGELDQWPAIRDELAQRYTVAKEWHPQQPERWWSRAEMPAAYRIYVHR